MTSTATYYRGSADSIKSWHDSSGLDVIAEEFLEFYQDNYSDVEQIGDMTIEIDEQAARLSVSISFRMDNQWEFDEDDKTNYFTIYASEIDADFPDFEGADRSAPFAISHPERTRQTLKFNVDDSWYFEDSRIVEENGAYKFIKDNKFRDEVYTETYEYVTYQDHIKADGFEDAMQRVSEIDDVLGVVMQNSFGEGSWTDSFSDEQIGVFFQAAFIIAAFMSLIGAVIFNKENIAPMQGQTFYPVAMPKFLILTFATLGIYLYYWVYKNWRWILKVQEDELMPKMRTFFMNIMNIALFLRFADHEKTGYNWYGFLALPLGIGFLITGGLANIYDRIPEAPAWMSLALFANLFFIIAPAMQVLKLNEGNDEAIAENSKFGLPSILLLCLWVPLFLIVVFGVAVILIEG